jgi:hypothetical protein
MGIVTLGSGPQITRNDLDGNPDPTGMLKDRLEIEIQAAILRYWDEQLARIRVRLGQVESRKAKIKIGQLVLFDTDEEEAELQALLQDVLARGAGQAVAAEVAALEAAGIAIDWTQAHTAASVWAREYCAKLVKGVTDTTRQQLAADVGAWVETPGANMGQLYDRLATSYGFSPKRAQAIAVTETTRAFSRGTMATARAVEADGLFVLAKFWHTSRDDRVCGACSPLHMKSVEGADAYFETLAGPSKGPPLHTRCRCFTTYVPKVRKKAEQAE